MVNGELKAECNHCHKFLTGKSSNGTRHLLDHMNTCKMRNNKDIWQQVLSMNQSSTTGQPNLSCHNFDKEKSTKDLAEMVILHEYPLVMVEHQGFRKFVRGLQPFFKVPCRNTIKKEILKIFEFEKMKTMRLLESNSSRIAITTDMWTSSNQKKGFVAVTAHFIDTKWNMQSRIMRFIYVPCPHIAQVLADVLYETLCDWNIDRKLSTVTVDNCTTNDLLMEKLLGKLSLESLILKGQLFHMRCCAHILNLIVQDVLSIIGDGIERIRDSVSFWTATPKRIEKFEEAARHLDIQSSKKFSLDCKTRWNSTYLMLNVAIIYKGVFRRLRTRDAHYNTLPTERDWELAGIICKKLKVFYDVTELFSGNKYPTANIFFKSMYEITYALTQWSQDSEKMIKEMAMKMILKYDKYWKVIHGFMGVAAILDPRYKLKIMEYSFPRLYSNVEDVKAEIGTHKSFM
ncbi:putative transcription factor/ chromatin remodeling BED-type(Zn) family [Helianthus annuus]|nr:putative transcription factor/ chromatin remodeling BED-type(Zn) family [Helianthus annuus]